MTALLLLAALAAPPVTVTPDGDGFRLDRGGEAYFIKGVGGSERLELARSLGANSVRTWGADGAEAVLDEAESLGMTVCVGLWLAHPNTYVDYADPDAVNAQVEQTVAAVRRLKDHPALLMWGVGNEMEGDGSDPKLWKALEKTAAAVKAEDPDHPTMTALAGSSERKTRALDQFCPSIDLVGLNAYGSAPRAAERYREAGGTRPFVMTEFGPEGPWEVAKTPWGSRVEPTSTAKAATYRAGYEGSVEGQPLCVGSYAFLWGNKQETTATWFGMFLPDGSPLAAAQAMSEIWTGRPPADRCPTIAVPTLSKTDGVMPGETLRASVEAVDPEGGPLQVEWVLRSDGGVLTNGAVRQAEEQEFPDLVAGDGLTAEVTAPAAGTYRLFAYVRDLAGHAAVANVPLRVE